ncbi:MAG: hypothetical protein IPL61_19125 [Myxococcales bacterium]|nr:hypothetical protein [Myxococcales bacterium]
MPGLTSRLRRRLDRGSLISIAVALAAAAAIYLGVERWLDGRSILKVTGLTPRPVELLDPRWLLLVAIAPFFYLVRRWSLTDLSFTQQVVQATLRTAIIAVAAIALARPTWVTRDAKVATVVLVDVSESVSDAQLAAARSYVDDLEAAKGRGWIKVITFAEKPMVASATAATS